MSETQVSAVDVMLARISELESQRIDVERQLAEQVAFHLRPYDVALNELKSLVGQLGGPVQDQISLASATPVIGMPIPRRTRSSSPVEMTSGDSITPEQMKAIHVSQAAQQGRGAQLEQAVRANNPSNVLRASLRGSNGNQD